MTLPDYWLHRPDMNLDHRAQSDFDQLLTQVKSTGLNTLIEYTLPHPKWQFLCYIADRHGIALHGTGDPNIHLFEPRQPMDLGDFSHQKAVYAAGDGLWAIFFAVVDRDHYPISVNNACIRLADESGKVSEPLYVFSVSQTILPQHPWRNGVVYLLPPDTFVTQPVLSFGPYEVRIPQLASLVAVAPLARLEVAPDDFPFLTKIRGHDDARLHEYGHAMQTGSPWPGSPGAEG